MCATAPGRFLAGLALLAVTLLGLPARGTAGGPAGEGMFVTVRTITSDETERIKQNTQEAVARFKATEKDREGPRRSFKIVLDFNPDGHLNASSDFGACYELAKHLRALQQDEVMTIAFVHNLVRGHAVLPVLACQDLVMSSEGQLGDVATTEGYERSYYEEVIRKRLRDNQAVALRMLNRDLRVRQVRRLDQPSPFYVDSKTILEAGAAPAWDPTLAALAGGVLWTARGTGLNLPAGIAVVRLGDEAVKVVLLDREAVDPAEPGTGRYDAVRAKQYGLCSLILETRQDVAAAYQMPPTSLREDPLLGRHPSAWRIDIRGVVNRAAVQSIQRRIRRAISRGATLLILQLDCGGGDFQAALDLAEMLRDLRDDRGELPVTTMAYIPKEAPDTGTIIALGCSQIVMHKDAQIGDFKHAIDSDPARNEVQLQALRALAKAQGYPELLVQGMMDRDVSIYSVISRQGQQYEWRLVTKDELDPQKWRIEDNGEVKRPGELLVLKATQAKNLSLTRHVVEGDPGDLRAVYTLYGLKDADVQVDRGDWLDEVREFLRHSLVAVFLVMLGVTCLILELKMPGVSLPGIVAAVCFILFFWAHSPLAGQWTWLAVLLFVLGLILLGLEIFVFPGFSVPGISGILLVLVSLALVTLERKPETTREWISFGATLTTFGLSMGAAVVAAMVIAWYLPHIPYVNRMILQPQGDAGEGEAEVSSLVNPELAALLGAIGVAATPLRPAGKVQFGDEFVDVVAEGSYVVPGSRVQVIEIEGNRIVVKEV